MSKIISIVNQKGGVGKTTLSLNIAYAIANLHNKKVLLIDNDPQGNLSSFFLEYNLKDNSIFDLYVNNVDISTTINSIFDNLDFIKSSNDLSELDLLIANKIGREVILKKQIEKIKSSYDYIIIDNNPSINLATINSLASSNFYCIPIKTDDFSLQGIHFLNSNIELIKDNINSDLNLLCVVITQYKNTKLHSDYLDMLKDYFKDKLLNNYISDSILIQESQALKKSIFEYKPNHKITTQYNNLVIEFMSK